MKLLTHNMLACHIRGVENGYPFKIEVVEVARHPAEYDPDFLRHILPRLEWPALLEGAKALGCADDLPERVDLGFHPRDDAFLRALHHALLEVALVEGALVCPETGRKFPVKKGIPNMLLHEDEC